MSDSLGTAQGRIVIDTTGVRAAQQQVQSASKGMEQALGAIGISAGIAGFVQLARSAADFAVESNKIATAYQRQSVAAVSLAGSQGKLNELLEVYNNATGNAVDKASALQNVTKLMAVGFADSSEELDKFARAIRGISIAMGTTQDAVTQNLILELFTQRGARLDQLGLQYDKVKERADALRAADTSLTQQIAYQQAVLEQAEERFGALANSSEGARTGLEHVATAWKDLQLAIGQSAQEPTNAFFDFWARGLENTADAIDQIAVKLENINAKQNNLLFTIGLADELQISGDARRFTSLSAGRDVARHSRAASSAAVPDALTSEATAAIVDWSRAVADIERQANADRLAATQQYEQQRTSILRDYGKTLVRESEDYALQRARAEEDSARSITRIREDSLRRETRMADDFARAIANARADSAERIADAQKDANKRLIEIDDDFKRNQKRREEDFKDDMLSAAGRLDAIRLLELRKDRARQLEDAEDAHKKQRDDLKEQLSERIADENKSLEKSTRQQQDAYDRQLADAREADARRLADMEAEFALRKEREDEDRAIRLERLAQDHADQLDELARQHSLRIAQIAAHAAEERTQLDAEFRTALAEQNIKTDAWIAQNKRLTDAAIAEFDRWWDNLRENSAVVQGPANRIPLPSFAAPASTYNPVPGWQRSVTVQSGAVVINAAPNQSIDALWNVFEDRFVKLINEN